MFELIGVSQKPEVGWFKNFLLKEIFLSFNFLDFLNIAENVLSYASFNKTIILIICWFITIIWKKEKELEFYFIKNCITFIYRFIIALVWDRRNGLGKREEKRSQTLFGNPFIALVLFFRYFLKRVLNPDTWDLFIKNGYLLLQQFIE